MKLAFCLFEYFPYGGLQRDFRRVAEACLRRGHQVRVFTSAWEGKVPAGFDVSVQPVRGFTNHRRCESYSNMFNASLHANHYDGVVGFNKMPGLDVYFAGDTCFAAKALAKSYWYRKSRRCRTYLTLEHAVFNRDSKTEILLLSEREKPFIMEYYGTPEQRFHLLPPGISKDCIAPYNAAQIRDELRRELSISPSQRIILMIGSGFRTKGVDRSIRAVSSLPSELRAKTVLWIVGEGKRRGFRRLAGRLGIGAQVSFFGARDDVPRFLLAADLLLHPAYQETAGMVLLEAMAAEVPVLATDNCGYSHHVQSANAGLLVPSPFKQEKLNDLLVSMLTSQSKTQWQQNSREYVATTDLFSLPEKAADVIEKVLGC
jgi:UDP-glucose:(heptosyl)LPS alpha-1,3-glucosyltransferase